MQVPVVYYKYITYAGCATTVSHGFAFVSVKLDMIFITLIRNAINATLGIHKNGSFVILRKITQASANKKVEDERVVGKPF